MLLADTKVAQQEEFYPEYSEHCSTSALWQVGGSRRLLAADRKDTNDDVQELLWQSEEARTLQSVDCRVPLPNKETTIRGHHVRVATAKDALDDNVQLRVRAGGSHDNNTALRQFCSQFCDGAIPLLLGATNFGFNLDEINQIALPNKGDSDAVLQYDQDRLTQCRRWGRTLSQVTRKLATFEKKRLELGDAKREFQVEVADSVVELQKQMLSSAFQDEMARTSGEDAKLAKVKETMALYLREVNREAALNEKADHLRHAAGLLLDAVTNAESDFANFLEQCDGLFLAVGPSKEYLLDIGSQDGNACIQEEPAKHVGCVCAYNPIGSLGSTDLDHPILGLGLQNERLLGQWHANLGRRLEGSGPQDDDVVPDLCASVWSETLESRASSFEHVLNSTSGKDGKKVLNREQALKRKYGDDYCAPFPCTASSCELSDLKYFVQQHSTKSLPEQQPSKQSTPSEKAPTTVPANATPPTEVEAIRVVDSSTIVASSTAALLALGMALV